MLFAISYQLVRCDNRSASDDMLYCTKYLKSYSDIKIKHVILSPQSKDTNFSFALYPSNVLNLSIDLQVVADFCSFSLLPTTYVAQI